jgi:hypothetical protein
MNNFFKTIAFFFLALLIVSCSKDDEKTEPLRDYTVQYEKDILLIEEFLQTHYITVVNNPGAVEDQDVTFTKIPVGGTQTPIWNSPDLVTDYYVKENDIAYKLYYLKLRQGSGSNSKSPCNLDRVLASYVGNYLYTTKETVMQNGVEVQVDVLKFNQFEESVNPQSYFTLSAVIKGWSEVFPKFKTGSYVGNPDGTLSYSDFGAGIMFIPSGLGYFGTATGGIPSYSPLIFNFKLYEIQRVDNDADGVYSFQEDIASTVVNSDGTVTTTNGVSDGYLRVFAEGITNPDDTDGDGTPDFIDIDDDGDFFMTKTEIKNPLTGIAYPYADIPLCTDGKKKHLTATCH